MIRQAAAWMIVLFTVLTAGAAGARPSTPRRSYPRSLADWREPRLGILWQGNSLYAALGSPVSLASGGGKSPWRLTLEGLALLGLSREGSFFPLETVDGHFLLAAETAWFSWNYKLRVVHWSAHQADGSKTVAYRKKTFSREWVSLEAGRFVGPWFFYGRLGAAWHAVPESRGLQTAFGLLWEPPGDRSGPFYAVHMEADRAQSYRLSQSHVAGWSWGTRSRSYLGLRYHSGFSFSGQNQNTRTTFVGLEIQFQPWTILEKME